MKLTIRKTKKILNKQNKCSKKRDLQTHGIRKKLFWATN